MKTDKLGDISSIRVQNFRLFKNNKFDFKPFTILVGPNSSGKSSFIKSLLLLKSKGSGRVTGESSGFDFSSEEHQLGDISLFKNGKKDLVYEVYWKEGISVEFGINKSNNLNDTDKVINRKLKIGGRLVIEQKSVIEKKDYFGKEFSIVLQNYTYYVDTLVKYIKKILSCMDPIDVEVGFLSGEERILGASLEDIKHQLFSTGKSVDLYRVSLFDNLYVTTEILDYLKKTLRIIEDYVVQCKYKGNSFAIELNDKTKQLYLKTIYGNEAENTTNKEEFIVLTLSGMALIARELFPIIGEGSVKREFGNTNLVYVPALKGLHQRYLPLNDSSTLSKIMDTFKSDFRKGRLSNAYSFQANIVQDSLDQPWYQPSDEFVEKWLKAFRIGSKVRMKKDRLRGIKYLDIDGGSLVDKGYGLTQLTAIILSISEAMKIEGTVILEEPETNLHPKFQSMLAEMMLYAKTYYDVSFIIETHSEYLIRKLQYLTAKKEIESKDTVIYYFHHPDEIPKGEKQIKKLTIRDDGMMDGDFGEGFFDESSRLTMDLLKMQNQN